MRVSISKAISHSTISAVNYTSAARVLNTRNGFFVGINGLGKETFVAMSSGGAKDLDKRFYLLDVSLSDLNT